MMNLSFHQNLPITICQFGLPSVQQMADRVFDKLLALLKGHTGPISSVCYNHRSDMLASMLASTGNEKIIKLGTPIAQE